MLGTKMISILACFVLFSIAPNGLCVMMMEEVPMSGSEELCVQLHLTTDMPGQPDIIAQCQAHCPFFVKGKGEWSC